MKGIMTTLVLKNNSLGAQQFLKFARTLPYIDIIEDDKKTTDVLRMSVVETLKKTEREEDLVVCENIDDLFEKLGI
jgi:hypothetical protein